jgi:SAM-dependent methyltransferase
MPVDHLKIYNEEYFFGADGGFGYTGYDRDKRAMVPTFHKYLDRLESAAPGRGALLDIGAATGFFLELARQRGWQVHGIEPSDAAAERARAKNLDVRTGVLREGIFAPASFEAITMWDVIEHVTDPQSAIRDAAALLKPGGVLAVNTPDSGCLLAKLLGSRWHLVVPPEHLNLFHRRSLISLLTCNGFEILAVASIGKRFTLQYVFQTLAHWQGIALWRTLAHRLRGGRVGQWGVPINLHDNFFLLARKR